MNFQLSCQQLNYLAILPLDYILRNPISTQKYDDKQFSILAIFIKTLNLILC